MNAEKMIKTEAKKMLSGKWPAAVTAVLTLLLVPLIVVVVVEAAYAVLPNGKSVIEELNTSIVMLSVFVVFHIAAITAGVMLSPMYTGFVRFFSMIADGGKADVAELFYFFETRTKYRQALKIMAMVLVESTAFCAICFSPAIGFTVMSLRTDTKYTYFIIASCVVGAIVAFLIIHRFAFAVTLFAYHGYSPEQAFSYGSKIAQKGTKKLIKLSGSFIGMILLTFLVVPIIYVFPYMTCSYFVSVKYLIKTYKEKYGDFGDSYADQKFKIDLGVGEIPQAVNPANTVSKSPEAPLKIKMTSPKKQEPTDTSKADEKPEENKADEETKEEEKTTDEAVEKS